MSTNTWRVVLFILFIFQGGVLGALGVNYFTRRGCWVFILNAAIYAIAWWRP